MPIPTKEKCDKCEKLLKQIRHLQKMNSLGQLLSCVVHEINNPITAILGFSEMLLEEDLPAGNKKDVELIRLSAVRCKEIVSNLLTVARKNYGQKKNVNLNTVVEQILQLKEYDFRVGNIIVEKEFEDKLPELYLDTGAIIQVLLNLLNNSNDALLGKKGGKITVTIRRTKGGVVIRVADNGPGILKEHLKSIFKPFYTTKTEGKGTGLGLYISREIVAEHGGTISAGNNPEGGALIELFLPVCKPLAG